MLHTRSRKTLPAKTQLAIEPLETRALLSATRMLGGLEFFTEGQFTTTTVGGQVQVRTASPVEVGLTPATGQAFNPLLRLTGGIEFVAGNGSGQFTAAGAIVGIIGDHEFPLATSATRELSATDLLGQGAGIADSQSVAVAGAEFTLSHVELTSNAVELQGRLDFPQLAGLSVAVEGDDYVVINSSGVHLTGLDASISGPSFQVGGVGFNLDSLHVLYSVADDAFDLSGSGKLQMTGNDIGITLGSTADPGIEIRHGQLSELTGSITGSFNLLGLKIDADQVGLRFATTTNDFAVFGGVHVSTPGNAFDHVGATLGTIDDPGLLIEQGQVEVLDVAVDGTINLYGLAVSAKDLNLHHDATSGLLRLVGGLALQVSPSFSAAAELTGDGVTIDTHTGAVIVNGVTFEADASFGPVQVHDLKIEYQKTTSGSVWSAAGTVQLAPGVAVDGSFEIVGGKLSRIAIDYAGPPLPIGDTGAYLTKIGGDIDHLDDPTNIVAALNAQVTYGKTVRFLGKDYGLLIVNGTLSLSKDQLDMDGNVQLVGGFLGEGTAHVILDWSNKEVRVVGKLSMYDGVFTYGAGVTITAAGDVTVDAYGSVNLPKLPRPIQDLASFLPTGALANAKLRLEIHPGEPANSFVAVEASALGLTGKFRYDASKGFSFGTFRGLTQWATGAIDAAGTAITKSWDAVGNTTDDWADKAGHTWKRVTQSFNPGQLGISYVTEYANGVRYLRTTLYFGSQAVREVWQAGWEAGVVGAQYVKQVFGSNARTITTTLENGDHQLRLTVYASGKTVREDIDATGSVVGTWVKDSATSAWKATTSALGSLKFW